MEYMSVARVSGLVRFYIYTKPFQSPIEHLEQDSAQFSLFASIFGKATCQA